jgi:HD-like signal output (HDOD) protein
MSLKFPERYGAMVRSIYNEDGDAVDTELDLFGFDHAMVGEALLGSWNLAHSLSDAVRWHHAPAHAPEGHRDLAAFVALGNQLALDRGVGLGRPESLREPTAQAMEILGFTEESLGVQRLAVVAALEADKNLIRDF